MIRCIPLLLWLTIAVSAVGCSGCSRIDVGRVLTSGRDGWQHPERVIERAVKGMLPKNTLGRQMAQKLKVYAGEEHPHAAQRPKPLDV